MATTVGTEYQMLIGGDWVGSDGGAFDVTNPATGETIATVPNATVEDVQRAVDAAADAFTEWQHDPRHRARPRPSQGRGPAARGRRATSAGS